MRSDEAVFPCSTPGAIVVQGNLETGEHGQSKESEELIYTSCCTCVLQHVSMVSLTESHMSEPVKTSSFRKYLTN